MSLVELIWATDRFSLYTQLESENRPDTFALRHMLWYLSSGKIKEGNVYVDEWPAFSHVCCLHPTTIYTKKDRDFATLSSKKLEEFEGFFSALIQERKWRQRDGVILAYIEEHLANIANRILCPDANYGKLWVSKPLPNYTAYHRKNLESYKHEFEKFQARMPSELSVSKVKVEEAHLVAEHWPYDIPEKTDMFKWLIENFPSACARDSQGRPVGWVISYNFGPSGAAYIYPEYRGRGLAEFVASRVIIELLKTNPSQRFFWILDDNIPSLKMTRRSTLDMQGTGMYMKLVAYIPRGNDSKAHL